MDDSVKVLALGQRLVVVLADPGSNPRQKVAFGIRLSFERYQNYDFRFKNYRKNLGLTMLNTELIRDQFKMADG